jgi:hypothetical protein
LLSGEAEEERIRVPQHRVNKRQQNSVLKLAPTADRTEWEFRRASVDARLREMMAGQTFGDRKADYASVTTGPHMCVSVDNE